jgi:hypothetical protein
MRIAVFNTISALRPYFFSLREIKENVSLDIQIPIKWGCGDFESIEIKVQDQKETTSLISIISDRSKEGYDRVFTAAHQIIQNNEEEEEKIKLFNQKVEELKTLFLSSPLDKLKDISFEKQLKKDGLRNKKGTREVGLGNEEGSGTDRQNQTKKPTIKKNYYSIRLWKKKAKSLIN